MELSFAGMRKTGRRRLGRYSQELSLDKLSLRLLEIKDLPICMNIPHIPHIPESLGLVLPLDCIRCMLSK